MPKLWPEAIFSVNALIWDKNRHFTHPVSESSFHTTADGQSNKEKNISQHLENAKTSYSIIYFLHFKYLQDYKMLASSKIIALFFSYY